VDGVQPPGLLRCDTLAPQHMDHAQDAVHRRADLVAHVGQEGALGMVGGFGRDLGDRQRRGAFLHQRLQVIAVLRQLLFGALAFTQVDVDAEHLRGLARHPHQGVAAGTRTRAWLDSTSAREPSLRISESSAVGMGCPVAIICRIDSRTT